MKLTFFVEESHKFALEYIKADDVIAFCLYLMNKMRSNLIKLKSCAIEMWWWWCWRRRESNRNMVVVVVVVEEKQ